MPLEGVPDGNGTNLMVHEFDSTYEIGCTGPFELAIVPFLPFQALLITHATFKATVNGATMNWSNIPGTPYVNPLITSKLASTFDNRVQPTQPTSDFARSGRIISQSWSLFYTGPAVTCQGTLYADSVPLMNDDVPKVRSGKIAMRVNSALGNGQISDGGFSVQANQNCMKLDITSLRTSIVPNYMTRITRPEHGMKGVLKRRVLAEAHTFGPVYQIPFIPIPDDSTDSTQVLAIYDSSSLDVPYTAFNTLDSTRCGLNFFDPHFEAERIRYACAPDNSSSWILRVKTCLQVEKSANHPYIELAKPAEPVNKKILEADDKLNTALPHAMPIDDRIMVPGMNSGLGRPSKRNRRRRRQRRRQQTQQQQQQQRPKAKSKGSRQRRGNRNRAGPNSITTVAVRA